MHYGMLRAICKNRVIVFAFLTAYLAVSALAFGQVMSEDLKLLPGDGGADHEFGNAIALDNGIVAIGARHDNDNGTNSGSAYLFDAYTGQEIVKLVPNDGAAGDEFGFSIAIAGGIVAVGTPGKGDNGAGSGAAYLFSATTGDQLAKLLPADGADGDKFGNAIAIDAGVVAVSAMYEDGFAEKRIQPVLLNYPSSGLSSVQSPIHINLVRIPQYRTNRHAFRSFHSKPKRFPSGNQRGFLDLICLEIIIDNPFFPKTGVESLDYIEQEGKRITCFWFSLFFSPRYGGVTC